MSSGGAYSEGEYFQKACAGHRLRIRVQCSCRFVLRSVRELIFTPHILIEKTVIDVLANNVMSREAIKNCECQNLSKNPLEIQGYSFNQFRRHAKNGTYYM